MCTPSRRCVPEHSRHMSVPYVTDAHDGFLAVQSKQTRSLCFAFIFRKTSSTVALGTSASGSGTAVDEAVDAAAQQVVVAPQSDAPNAMAQRDVADPVLSPAVVSPAVG
eukprot:scaffold22744_cov55-Phaeocystis_antarctica.AAC.2